MATLHYGAPSEGSEWRWFDGAVLVQTHIETTPERMIIRWDYSDGRFFEERYYGEFTYDVDIDSWGRPVAYGRLDVREAILNGELVFRYGALSVDMQLARSGPIDDEPAYHATIFAGDDALSGDRLGDWLHGYGGSDTIVGGDGANYLRGGEGNDSISGGADFDNAHGNEGNDTVRGGGGDDWVVGGKDNDLLFGDEGDDIVLGNLGDDTCDGGDGNDVVRGGQGNDVIHGGAGNDWLSGDRGDDTITGGDGSDVFHTFGDAGFDLVLDFDPLEDRVQLDPGTSYTVTQVGADVEIAMAGGGRMVLANVQLSALTAGWIFGA